MSRRTRILLAFASVYLLWGSTFVAIRYVAQLLHPAFVSGLRYVLAGAVMMAYLLLRRRPVRLSRGDLRRVTLLGLIMFTLNTTLVSYGGRVLPAGLTALYVASIPLFLGVLEALVPKGARMSRMGWAGTLTGFAGLGLLTHHGMAGPASTREKTLACAALLLAALAWAVGSMIARRMAMESSPMVSSAWQMLLAGTINMLIGVAAGGLHTSHWTRGAWAAMLYLALFGSVAGYTSYLFLLRNVRLAAAATYAYINPIVAVLLGWALLGETLHGTEWLGMAIVVAAVAIVIAAGAPGAKPAAQSGFVEKTKTVVE